MEINRTPPESGGNNANGGEQRSPAAQVAALANQSQVILSLAALIVQIAGTILQALGLSRSLAYVLVGLTALLTPFLVFTVFKRAKLWLKLKDWWSGLHIAIKVTVSVVCCIVYGYCLSRAHRGSWAVAISCNLLLCSALYSVIPILVRGSLSALAFLVASLGFWLPPLPPPPCDVGSFNRLLRLQGSDALGTRLGSALAQGFLKHLKATVDEPCPVSTNPRETLIKGTLDGEKKAIEIGDQRTESSLQDLIDNPPRCHVVIGKSSSGVKFPLDRHFLGTDAIVIIVHPENTLETLEMEKVRKIFAGNIAIWEQVPRAEHKYAAINIYALNDDCDESGIFKSSVMGKVLFKDGTRHLDGRSLLEKIAGDRDGIGFVSRSVAQLAKGNVKILKINGVDPSEDQITDYPLTFDVYLFKPAKYYQTRDEFVTFAMGEGQKLVKDSGLFPRDSMLVPLPNQGTLEEYRKLTADAIPLPVDFHFDKDIDQIRPRENERLRQIAQLVRDSSHGRQDLLVFGFADGRGEKERNMSLSERRAARVAKELGRLGLNVSVIRGYGSKAPMDSNDTPEGREKNRRVEIWSGSSF